MSFEKLQHKIVSNSLTIFLRNPKYYSDIPSDKFTRNTLYVEEVHSNGSCNFSAVYSSFIMIEKLSNAF